MYEKVNIDYVLGQIVTDGKIKKIKKIETTENTQYSEVFRI